MQATPFPYQEIQVQAGSVVLDGNLSLPENPPGVVLFAHGSGSSRFSSRNQAVAQTLHEAGLATLLIDLLTAEEDRIDQFTRQFRFDIPRLAGRVTGAIAWLQKQPETRRLPVGLFGASTGAAAALIAAAEVPQSVGAVVSRGGRPDLAGEALRDVHVPTLLIVGGDDVPVIGMNRDAVAQMPDEVTLEIVPGATHLFGEPGALEKVADLAKAWFLEHLA